MTLYPDDLSEYVDKAQAPVPKQRSSETERVTLGLAALEAELRADRQMAIMLHPNSDSWDVADVMAVVRLIGGAA